MAGKDFEDLISLSIANKDIYNEDTIRPPVQILTYTPELPKPRL